MPSFAQLDHDVVTGILVADTMPVGERLPDGSCQLPAGRTFVLLEDVAAVSGGETYDKATATFTPKDSPSSAPEPRLSDLMEALTAIAEKLAVDLPAKP